MRSSWKLIKNENNQINDLDIKLDLDKRDKVISFLQTENILGWLSSIEDSKSELEICLFPKDFNSINEFVEQLDIAPSNCPNSLEFFKNSTIRFILKKESIKLSEKQKWF